MACGPAHRSNPRNRASTKGDPDHAPLLRRFIGTFILVLCGCGSAVLAGDHIGFSGVALSFGFTLMALIYALGPISGCHLNPAVTLA